MKKKTLFWIIGIAVVIIIIAAAGGGGDGTPADQTEDSTPEEWVELISFSGNGEKKSTSFTYGGGEARLRYEFDGDADFGVFSVYVVKKGEDVMRDGGFPEVMLTAPESGESNLSHLRKGEYYLNVSSANGTWSIVVEELK